MISSQGIPVVSLAYSDATSQFGRALQQYGFVSLVDHGFRTDLLPRLYEAAAKAFALPVAIKQSYERPELLRQIGYASYGAERAEGSELPDHKEHWHVMPQHPLMEGCWPAAVPEFRTLAEAAYGDFWSLGEDLLAMLSLYLRESSSMAAAMEGGETILRVLHYPPLRGDEAGERAAAHSDINLLTILPDPTGPGLEVLAPDGTWLPVRPPPGAVVVNAGDMLQVKTRGRIPSAKHRVVNVPGDGGRFSAPCFIHPHPGTILTYVPRCTAGRFLRERLTANYK